MSSGKSFSSLMRVLYSQKVIINGIRTYQTVAYTLKACPSNRVLGNPAHNSCQVTCGCGQYDHSNYFIRLAIVLTFHHVRWVVGWYDLGGEGMSCTCWRNASIM